MKVFQFFTQFFFQIFSTEIVFIVKILRICFVFNCSEHFITSSNNFLTLIFVLKNFIVNFKSFFFHNFPFIFCQFILFLFISFFSSFFFSFLLFSFILFCFVLFYFILFFLLLLDSGSVSSSGVPGAIPLGTITAELGPGFTIHSVCAFEKNDVLEVCHLI